ncbi:MAG: DUF4136 domain-containing protein [Desulfobulbaceae bacterium]|nr:DUF4136 domain-containing protein [Desulfobulbaceae bacterium]
MNTKISISPRHTMLFRLFSILLGLLALVSACTSVQVSQDYDTNFTFGTTNTFGWNAKLQHENSDLQKTDELLAKRFWKAIENVLASQGFKLNERPNFLVSYTFSITSKLQIDPGYSSFGYGFGRYGYYRGVGINTGNSMRQYDQGKLVINIHSATTNQLLWKGTGTREMYTHSNPAQITRNVHEMVEAVLAQFPPLI